MARKTKEIISGKESEAKIKSSTLAKKSLFKEKKESNKPKESKKIENKAEATPSKKVATKSKVKTSSTAKKTTKSKTSNEVKKEDSLNIVSSSKKTKKVVKTVSRKAQTVFTPEYYDLPYRYNQTVVKILAQTPTNLFIYWDISDADRENLKKTYGGHIFEITKPVLIIHNITMNYSFEVDINDFANSWYLHINDSKCKYKIELGRRPIPINYSYITNYSENDEPIKPIDVPYIYISSSNEIESPNDKILFNKEQNMVYFRNVKTNQVTSKDISSLTFIQNMGKFYKISDLYKKLYNNEEINEDFILGNPGSGTPTSGSLSSRFN